MSCFDGIVKLNGCSITEVPQAVYSLNSLPGISLKSFEQVANSEQQNYIGVWNAINERAEARMKNQIISYMSTRYDIKRVRRTVDVFGDDELPTTSNNLFKGIVINSAYTLVDNWKISPLQTTTVDKIRFYKSSTTTATTIDVKFFNYLSKEILFTKTLTVANMVNGWNEFSILKQFDCAILAIGFLDTNINGVTYSTTDSDTFFASCFSAYYDCGTCGQINGFVSSNSSANGTLTYNTIADSLQVLLTLGCSYDSAVCSNRMLFAEAYWYALGIEFMTERLYSERTNFYTTVKREEANELLALYTTRYEEAIKNALGGIKLECDACLECNSQVQVFTQIP
jgi:hypothetical protein